MALPLPVAPPDAPPQTLAPQRIRRCTFRRMSNLGRAGDGLYVVECLYPNRRRPLPLGDLESATPICNACTAAHIFRPDED
ncbi:MAG TPA: hypothetical protein VNO86_09035 [Candidatus Binatia bacterium]|nr:hypothetical protein [Candidatus Binatia bacterium]